ncbi:MAG: CRISPR-associated endonuclease Cas2 [Mollicutes bacterium]|nr:CRISPR-associated endonuclease Cas2 [Mollicutes bacterium]
MRCIVFFDLPTVTYHDRKNYERFRKYLLSEGFIMMQESVYTKLTLTPTTMELLKRRIRKNVPPKGLVQMLVVTEKQFASIEYLVGNRNNEYIDSTSRMVIL